MHMQYQTDASFLTFLVCAGGLFRVEPFSGNMLRKYPRPVSLGCRCGRVIQIMDGKVGD